jgi:hypothetical protein
MRNKTQIEAPAELLADDVTLAADVLLDVVDDTIPNTLPDEERRTLEDVIAWLRRSAKALALRDATDWDTTQAMREARGERERNLRHAALHGVGEATVREAAIASRIARRVRRIA